MRVHFLLCRATTDNYHPHTISGLIKLLTTFCSRACVIAHVSICINCHFTSDPTWPPHHPSKSTHTSIAMSSHRTRGRPVTSCRRHSQKRRQNPIFYIFSRKIIIFFTFYWTIVIFLCMLNYVVCTFDCEFSPLSCCQHKFINLQTSSASPLPGIYHFSPVYPGLLNCLH